MDSRPKFAVILRLGVMMVLSLVLICCGKDTEREDRRTPVRIALMVPLSGPLKAEGQMLRLGAELAMNEIGGGLSDLGVKMVVYDSPCKAEREASIARQVAGDPSVRVVIGYLCSESVRTVLSLYGEAELPMITPIVPADDIQEGQGQYLFPLMFGSGEQAAFLAAYIRIGLGLTKVAVVNDQSVYGNLLIAGFLQEAKHQGLELVASIVTAAEPAAAVEAVELLKTSRAEATFLAASPESVRLILVERHRRHLGGEILGPDLLADRDLFEMSGQAAEGLLVCQPLLLGSTESPVAEFVQRFELANKRRPDWIAAGGYDALRLALEVLRRAGTGRSNVLQGLRGISGPDSAFNGLGGPVFFGDGSVRKRPLYVARVHQGTLQPANPSTVAFTRASSHSLP
jgi:branched-chain amino acid transport system substrate-binding protein